MRRLVVASSMMVRKACFGEKACLRIGSCWNSSGLQQETRRWFHTSERKFNDVEALNADRFASQLVDARNLYYNKEYDKSIALCNRILAQEKEHHHAKGLRGLCYYHQGRFESALNDLEQYLQMNLLDFESKLFKAYCLFKLQRFDEMLEELNSIIFVTSPSDDPARFISSRLLRSNYYIMARDVDLAFSDLHAIEQHLNKPNFIVEGEQLAQFYEGISMCYAHMGQHEKAVFYLSEYIDKFPSTRPNIASINTEHDKNLNLKRAISNVELFNFTEALKDIDIYISDKGLNEMPGVLILRAKALAGLERYKEAHSDIERFHRLDVVKMYPYMLDPAWLEEADKIRTLCEQKMHK